MSVILGNLQVDYIFIVLDTLLMPVILGCDFLTKHNVIMDFSQQVLYHSDNPSFKLGMCLVRMILCKALVPKAERPQQNLASKWVFSNLKLLCSIYWQFPM